MTRELWHFTCADHGYANLGERGFLLPRAHPLMPELGSVVWLTSDPYPDRDDVGLTSNLTSCDRLAYRYRIDSVSRCLPWLAIRSKVNREWRDNAERYGAPETWFISREKIAATLDQPRVVLAAGIA